MLITIESTVQICDSVIVLKNCIWGSLESSEISVAAACLSPGGIWGNTCQSHIWSQNCLCENNFSSLLLSENSMSKTFLHCVQWRYVISTENITLLSLLVMFTLEISNRNMHALSFAFALFLPHPTALYQESGSDLEGNQHDKCNGLPLSHREPLAIILPGQCTCFTPPPKVCHSLRNGLGGLTCSCGKGSRHCIFTDSGPTSWSKSLLIYQPIQVSAAVFNFDRSKNTSFRAPFFVLKTHACAF